MSTPGQTTSGMSRCPQCGALLLPGTPAGLCPRCLLNIAAGDDEAQDPPQPLASALGIHRFGDYELLEVIGHGGMGKVFRARHISLNRMVALKMIHAGRFAGAEEVLRFRREAEAAASLDHPNIVHIYEVGCVDNQHYFTMKFVEGGTLAKLIARGRSSFDLRDAVLLLARVARALHHAHQRGIMHRDLKPANILLNNRGEPLVADFGLARLIDQSVDPARPEGMLGTIGYMAPEQLSGKGTELTTAVDIHALGCILYEMITGRAPYQARSLTEAVQRIPTEPIVPPRQLNPSVDPDLEAICLKCLEKQPDTRYAFAAALAEDLERWLDGKPVLARPLDVLSRAWRSCTRNPLRAGLAGVGTLGAAMWLFLSIYHSGKQNSVPEVRPVVPASTDGTFTLDILAGSSGRCTENFEARRLFGGKGRLVRVGFENVPKEWLSRLQIQIQADQGGRSDPTRSPVLRDGGTAFLKTDSGQDRAFYATAVNFSVSNLLAAAPEAKLILVLSQEGERSTIAGGQPAHIISMNPLCAVAGASVMLVGENFYPEPVVHFPGAIRAVVTAASATNLTVTVPAGTKYGPVTVTVSGLIGSSPRPFVPTFTRRREFGPSTLGNKLTFVVPMRAGLALVDDLDGDGRLDLAVMSYEQENAISLFRNTSVPGNLDTNSFTPRFDLMENGQFVSNFGAVADLDGDSRPDLVLPSFGGALRLASSAALPGKLDANSFVFPAKIPARGNTALIRDFDGDGRLDVALYGRPSFEFLIYQNLNSYWPLKASAFRLVANLNSDMLEYGKANAEDLDGDGKPDLITSGSGKSDRIYVRRNIGVPGDMGPQSFEAPVEFSGPVEMNCLLTGDLDGDGRLDLVAGGYSPHTISMFRNRSTPGSWDTNSFAPRINLLTSSQPERMALGDLDGDGKLDLAVPLEFEDAVLVFINRSTPGRLDFAPPVRFATDPQPLTTAIADLDGDGAPEIITANFQGTITILRNDLTAKPQ